MDIGLKGKLGGIRAGEYINQHFRIPIIFISANSDEKVRRKIKKISSFGLLRKPFIKNEIFSVLRKFAKSNEFQVDFMKIQKKEGFQAIPEIQLNHS